MRRLLLLALLVSIACAVVGAAQARQAGTSINLVAYSTPKPVMQKLISRFGHTAAGNGVSLSK